VSLLAGGDDFVGDKLDALDAQTAQRTLDSVTGKLSKEQMKAVPPWLRATPQRSQSGFISRAMVGSAHALDPHRGGFAAADADRRNATLEIVGFQGRQERHQNPRA